MFLVISICPLAIYNSCAALFRAMNDSKTTMLIVAAMNLINLVGNAILIYGVKIGVAGAAIAAAFSRIAAAGLSGGLWFLRFSCGCRPLSCPIPCGQQVCSLDNVYCNWVHVDFQDRLCLFFQFLFSWRPAGRVDCHDNRLGFPRNLL